MDPDVTEPKASRPGESLQSYIETILSYSRTTPGPAAGDSLIQQLIQWPPDLFVVTSQLLRLSGAYVYSILPPEEWPVERDWQGRLWQARTEWYAWIAYPGFEWQGELSDGQGGGMLQALPALRSFVEALPDSLLAAVSLGQLRDFVHAQPHHGDLDQPDTHDRGASYPAATDPAVARRVWQVCSAVLALHALADEICAGFGTPSGSRWVDGRPPANDGPRRMVQGLANMLLSYTGSLSQFPPYLGVVLPKLRTPAGGMTIRNLSHNLTFHQSEVDVVWRALPWVNIDENTVNILVVPWPYDIDATAFRPSRFTTARPTGERTRFFEFIGGRERYNAAELLAMIEQAERHVNRIHLIIFPELALTEEERNEILYALAGRRLHQGGGSRNQVPMLLAGIRASNPADDTATAAHEPQGTNRVVLSTFFAGRWYQLEQHKHHRWKLDRRQINQYRLGGALAAHRDWWEAIGLPGRKLSVLAPSGWLALCPLICEDLARQEPISDLIRGIGPTLLIALLLDGPQLRQRWPGRYASVLADDPGCSVLTVSPLGLTSRSSLERRDARAQANALPDVSAQIGLWNDSLESYCDIVMENPRGGIVLTIDARWSEEFTADGRSDRATSAIFVANGIHQVGVPDPAAQADPAHPQAVDPFSDPVKHWMLSKATDVLEITLFTFFVDVTIDCLEHEQVDQLHDWLAGRATTTGAFAKLASVQRRIRPFARAVFAPADGNLDVLGPFIQWFCTLIDGVNQAGGNRAAQLLDYSRQILETTRRPEFLDQLLAGQDPFADLRAAGSYAIPSLLDLQPQIAPAQRHILARICVYSALAILWALHDRLHTARRYGELNRQDAQRLYAIERLLEKDYEAVWFEAIARSPAA